MYKFTHIYITYYFILYIFCIYCIHVHLYVHKYTCIFIYIYIYICICVCTYKCICILLICMMCVDIFMYNIWQCVCPAVVWTCMCVWMSVCSGGCVSVRKVWCMTCDGYSQIVELSVRYMFTCILLHICALLHVSYYILVNFYKYFITSLCTCVQICKVEYGSLTTDTESVWPTTWNPPVDTCY